ncbi:MAG: hypothetical protein SGILL_003733 [Bacillariaceae sp.]
MLLRLASPTSSVLRKGLGSPLWTRQWKNRGRRSFFASSTDHTRLLKEAEVHRVDNTEDGTVQYVLVDYGMDAATVKKVPQLHLGRLSCTTISKSKTIINGVKVVNKTLGDCTDVCGKLLEAALSDARQSGSDDIRGLAALHGVSEYVLGQSSVSPSIKAIAKNESESTSDQDEWEKVCHLFVEKGMSTEAKLYQDHGGILSHIEHGADTGDYANTCAGSMAVFRF